LPPAPRQPAGAARAAPPEPAQSTIPARPDGRRARGDRAAGVRGIQAGRARAPRDGRLGDLMTYLLPIIALFFLLWLFVIRPQRRRQLQQLHMQDELHLDDEIITAGGIHGYVKQLDDAVLTIEIAPGVRVQLDRRAVAGKVLPEEPDP